MDVMLYRCRNIGAPHVGSPQSLMCTLTPTIMEVSLFVFGAFLQNCIYLVKVKERFGCGPNVYGVRVKVVGSQGPAKG